MRPIAGLLLTLAAAVFAAQACAQSALVDDVFVSQPQNPTALAVRDDSATTLGAGGVFSLPAFTGSGGNQARLSDSDQLVDGQGLVVWRTNEVTLPHPADGAVDTLRLSLGGVARSPGGVVLARPDALLDPDAQAFDVSYTRGWPSAWSLSNGHYALDISPHAGLGMNSFGGTAEAGAMVRLGADLEHRLDRLGLHHADASAFADRGRWFLFAAASGRAVGLNMLPNDLGALARPSWSMEPSSALISDAQAGIAWRKGSLQASLGYVHRSVKSQTEITTGPGSYRNSMVAFSFSLHAR